VLVLGHVAAATVSGHALDRRADLRWVIFFTLLADLVDKPLGLVVFRETINNGRVWFHSLSVNLLLTLVLVLARKPGVYSLALWLHQLCDRMWMRPWVALWPFTGAFGFRYLPLENWVYSVLNPYNLVSEAIGLLVLAEFARRTGLFHWQRLLGWARTGELSPSG
jgi:inner membrane protein